MNIFLNRFLFTFTDEPPKTMLCLICKAVLNEARQTSCGCRMCRRCIEYYLKDGNKFCPSKRSDCIDTMLSLTENIYQDKAIDRKISNLMVHCPSKLCNRKEMLRNMISHADLCTFKEVTSEKCSVQNVDYDKYRCSQRIIRCPYCLTSMTVVLRDTVHLNIENQCIFPCSVRLKKDLICHSSCFFWKISDFAMIKVNALRGGSSSLTTYPFYSSNPGYKLCLTIYPNGYGIGRSTHLSVLFAIMKGDFDNFLSWPFQQKVTLRLIDQEGNGAKNHSVKFTPNARLEHYQRPLDDCNRATGCLQFFLLANLLPRSVYIANGAILLQCFVEEDNILQ